jgi:hypothetical protein
VHVQTGKPIQELLVLNLILFGVMSKSTRFIFEFLSKTEVINYYFTFLATGEDFFRLDIPVNN